MDSNFNLLSGKTAIITGASRGIGKAVAETFAKNGCDLFLISRNEELLTALQKELTETYNVFVKFYAIDITNHDDLAAVFKDIRASKKPIDVLVNNAGIMEDAILQMVKPELIQKTYATNVFALIDMSKRASKLMFRQKKGSIINLTSIIGVEGNKGQSIYSSSKSAVIGFTKSLSKELAPLNIRVNSVAPGFIETNLTKDMTTSVRKKTLESIGFGRAGKPEDVAKVILFLASDLSEYVTGQIIGVDGGMII
ncbi:MAG: SDR family NAD(P)-dependent oxidoreductase [Flavobacteriales bacterium]